MTLGYRTPSPADAAELSGMARASFAETFAAHFPPEPFARYLDQAYGPEGVMTRDLADPAIRWQVATDDGAIVGYAKLTPLDAPAPSPQRGAMELRQLYVTKALHGRGVADALMTWTVDTARAAGASELYLAVFDWNTRARRFYQRHGFAQVGEFDFDLGGMAARDTIWRRAL